MCGICGFIKLNNNNTFINEQYIKDMNDQMITRGPNGGGIWLDKENRIGLGHRRLSIIDLSPNASQPMSNEDNSIQVVFNGEIYNHRQIRAELEKIGKYKWKTDHSDTEVIIHAYEEWGIQSLNKFRGMFAIALWDSRKEEFWLIRDRMGIKPLYYMVQNGILTFASEIKSLVVVSKKKFTLDEKATYDYLTYLCSPGENTLFKEIKKVRPASYISIKRGQLNLVRYWDVLDNINKDIYYNAKEEDIINLLKNKLKESIKLRQESDVPIGVFLSGGVDSSTNAVLFSESKLKVNTFSVGYDKNYNSYTNELFYANRIAKQIKSRHFEIILNEKKIIDFIPQLINLQSEPLADPVAIPIYYISKKAVENGIFVCQVGEGADELLGGYPYWKECLSFNKKLKYLPKLSKKIVLNVLQLMGQDYRKKYELLRRNVNNQPIYWSEAEDFFERQKKAMLSEDMNNKLNFYTSFDVIKDTFDRFEKNSIEPSIINWMTYAELNHRLPELLLSRIDKMSMSVSLECRAPFLDHEFVELCMSIPSKMKIKNGESKYLLKKAIEDIIPQDIIYRKKQGFGVPIYEWCDSALGNMMKEQIIRFTKESNIFNMDFINSRIDSGMLKGRRLWTLYNLASWWNIYIK